MGWVGGRIHDYLEAAGQSDDEQGPAFRPIRNKPHRRYALYFRRTMAGNARVFERGVIEQRERELAQPEMRSPELV